LMLSALGCCAMYYATEYLRARNLAFDSTELRISAVKGGEPARMTEIEIEVDAPALGVRARDGLMKAIDACLLKRTLADPPKLKVSLVPLAIEALSNTPPASLAP
jgi:putative redox protein